MAEYDEFSTQAIHSGQIDEPFGAAVSPLYDSTTFSFTDTEALLEVVGGQKQAAFYTRYGMNPSITSLEQRLAALDRAESSLAYGSGMAAISSISLAFGRGGIVCVGEIYGGTTVFLQQQASLLGINSRFIASGDDKALESTLEQGASLVYMETPANPTLKVIDIEKTAMLSHRHGARLVVDNTFATPINQQPLSLGADLALQSATKYLGGHSDLTAGVVSGRDQDITELNHWRKSLGQAIAPEIAHKLKRSLVTLPLRVERHNSNAQTLAEFLHQHPAVAQVYYPGLPSSPDHDLAARQMQGFGGMLSFDIKDSGSAARQFVDKLSLMKLAPSLGGAETLITQPVTSSHYGLPQQLLDEAGISERMIRLSVGLEAVQDLIRDLEQALAVIA
ncbi:PLP-dependent aspartate aminotransferase family protein [Methylophaga sp.]|uniref:trans-sulfuration enzyme family protein n=1 Tax=Methylophaga sp. TaxID=2024840 RepID=UPI001400880A|nr:PLP-dependent aspartate aminotransferase family protein [Methylophaga sp.]MTI62434.1 PLP-dependent transferase [Methylophaga sp.]